MRKTGFVVWIALLGCDDNAAGDGSHSSDSGVIALDDASSVGTGDAGLVVDSGGKLANEAQSHAVAYEGVLRKLRECGVLGAGKRSGFADSYYFDRCVGRCLQTISCEEVRISWCGHDQSNLMITACMNGCQSERVICPETMRTAPRCDGVMDCRDGSDEAGCFFFTCKDGKRIREALECDFMPDCADGSDEVGCLGAFFKCPDGSLPPEGAIECNGSAECADGSDERDCVERGLGILCDGGKLIGNFAVCDDEQHCADGADEKQGCAPRLCDGR